MPMIMSFHSSCNCECHIRACDFCGDHCHDHHCYNCIEDNESDDDAAPVWNLVYPDNSDAEDSEEESEMETYSSPEIVSQANSESDFEEFDSDDDDDGNDSDDDDGNDSDDEINQIQNNIRNLIESNNRLTEQVESLLRANRVVELQMEVLMNGQSALYDYAKMKQMRQPLHTEFKRIFRLIRRA